MAEAVVDANVLIRYLTDRPSHLADRAADLLEGAERAKRTLVIAPLTVAEIVYVLTSVYGWDKQAVAGRLLDLIMASVATVLDQDAVMQALVWFRDVPGVHFADAYVAALAVERRADVISFDAAMRRLPIWIIGAHDGGQ